MTLPMMLLLRIEGLPPPFCWPSIIVPLHDVERQLELSSDSTAESFASRLSLNRATALLQFVMPPIDAVQRFRIQSDRRGRIVRAVGEGLSNVPVVL